MKTELEIAKENIENYKKSEYDFPAKALCFKFASISHKASCQRFLEFLLPTQKMKRESTFSHEIDKKITDLRNAIKLYDEAGI